VGSDHGQGNGTGTCRASVEEAGAVRRVQGRRRGCVSPFPPTCAWCPKRRHDSSERRHTAAAKRHAHSTPVTDRAARAGAGWKGGFARSSPSLDRPLAHPPRPPCRPSDARPLCASRRNRRAHRPNLTSQTERAPREPGGGRRSWTRGSRDVRLAHCSRPHPPNPSRFRRARDARHGRQKRARLEPCRAARVLAHGRARVARPGGRDRRHGRRWRYKH
jgi:hypothetical protein